MHANVRAREYRGCVPLLIVGVVARPVETCFGDTVELLSLVQTRQGQETEVGIVERNKREREDRFTENGEQRQQVVR